MPTAAQDQWLGKLGVNMLPTKLGPKSGAGTPLQAGAETASAPAMLGKIPVPQISGESKDALMRAMRTIDSIQPSERARGFFTIVMAEGTKQISKAQADNIRGKTRAALKRNISAIRLKAEAAMDRYSEQKRVNADQWAVSAVVTFARKVTTLGRFEDPGPTLTKEVEAARAGIAAAADANSFAKAAEAFAGAEAAAAKAAGIAQVYVAGMIEGAGASITMLEGTRDLAFITEAALATVAMAGIASGAIAASTTALGGIGTVATANVIATAAPIAGGVAAAATKVALGDKVDWGAVAIDASLQLFIARFGGPATKGIAAAVTKRLAEKLAAKSIARIGLEKMVQAVVLQEGSTTLATAAQSLYAAMRGKDITWEQVFKTLLARLTDPKGLAVAAVLAGITTRAEMKSDGLFPDLTDEEVDSAIDDAKSEQLDQHPVQDPGLEAPREPPESDELLPELTEKEIGTAVDDATSGTPLSEKVYKDNKPEIDEATDNGGTDGAESSTSDKLLSELTDAEVGSAIDNARAGTMIEAPGQNPHTGEGLIGVEIRADETAAIAYHKNMTFKGIAGVPRGDQTQVRRNSANARAPAGSYSRDNPTTQINTIDPAGPRRSKELRLPDGTLKRFEAMTEEERASAHLE